MDRESKITHQNELKQHVQKSFDVIRKALDVREKLLLRQIDLLCSQHKDVICIDQINYRADNHNNLLDTIRKYGRFDMDNLMNLRHDFLIAEDYISPQADHDIMYKGLTDGKAMKRRTPMTNMKLQSQQIAQNQSHLIKIDEENSIKSLGETKKIDKSTTTITSTVDKPNQNKNVQTSEPVTSTTNSTYHAPHHLGSPTNNNGCEFYKRLLEEIKSSLNKQRSDTTPLSLWVGPLVPEVTKDLKPESCSVNLGTGRNINLNIFLTKDLQSPTQHFHIEQWLKQIIDQTEIEPVHNVDILEHNSINTAQ